jgi:hypothetical protein
MPRAVGELRAHPKRLRMGSPWGQEVRTSVKPLDNLELEVDIPEVGLPTIKRELQAMRD